MSDWIRHEKLADPFLLCGGCGTKTGPFVANRGEIRCAICVTQMAVPLGMIGRADYVKLAERLAAAQAEVAGLHMERSHWTADEQSVRGELELAQREVLRLAIGQRELQEQLNELRDESQAALARAVAVQPNELELPASAA